MIVSSSIRSFAAAISSLADRQRCFHGHGLTASCHAAQVTWNRQVQEEEHIHLSHMMMYLYMSSWSCSERFPQETQLTRWRLISVELVYVTLPVRYRIFFPHTTMSPRKLMPHLLLKEKVYITLSPIGGGLHNPQPMKRSISPPELSKTGQITA